MADMFAQLAAPFPVDTVSWRVGALTKDKLKTRALAYIDARDVMRRLDQVCGAGGWQCEYQSMQNGTTCCRIGIDVSGEVSAPQWVWKANGAGATDVEGDKGAYSDAFKRAAVLWGIGQYLYDIDSPWVEVDEWKQIKKTEHPKLRAALSRNGEPAKSAYQVNKDGEWKTLIAGLNAAIQVNAVDEFLNNPETFDVVAKWPYNFREAWEEKCAAARERAAG